MTTNPKKADDDVDALESLEAEAKAFNKVSWTTLVHGNC